MKKQYAFLLVFGLVAIAASSQASDITFTTVEFPGSSETIVTGISGSNVIGNCDYGGFIYDGSTFKTLDNPALSGMKLTGVSGNTVFGTGISVEYNDEDEDYEGYGPGFVAQLEVPEPRISLTASNTIVISWPYPSTGWNLQQNSDLTTTNWVTPSEAVAYNGTNDFINVGRPPGNLFFRLSHP